MRPRSTLRLAPLLLGAALLSACADRLPSAADPGDVLAPGAPRRSVTPTNAFFTIDAGYNFACGIVGGGQAWCWGQNSSAQLGDSTAAPTTVPVSVVQPSGVTFASIVGGGSHTCALTSLGAAYCWGYNGDGRLGIGHFFNPMAPEPVQGGISFFVLTAGEFHICGLDNSGQAYCWGSNNHGQVGDDTKNNYRYTPTAVHQPVGVTFVAIEAGDYFTCALDTGGQAYCWGYGGDGAVGNNSLLGSKVPVAVQQPVGVTFTSISATFKHACGVDAGGQAYCWGYNFYGQLGDGTTTTPRLTPVAVSQPSGVTFSSVAAGGNHSCGMDGDGLAYCWGDDTNGQLGNGSTAGSITPVAVSHPSGAVFTKLFAARSHSCALDGPHGQAYCWGRNNFGQMGDSTTTNRTAPVAVSH